MDNGNALMIPPILQTGMIVLLFILNSL